MTTGFDFALRPSRSDEPLDPLRDRIARAVRTDEAEAVRALVTEARFDPAALEATQVLATRLAAAVRAERSQAGGVDALMLEFSLESREGIALMCLAEALLRIPDAATRDRLIRDKIGRGDWLAHAGASPSLFVNAAAWGLVVTGRLVASRSEGQLADALASLLRKGGEPLIRKAVDLAMWLLGRQFVTGRTIAEALDNARVREARGYTYSFDMLGEAALTASDATRYYAAYEDAIHAIGRAAKGAGPIAGPGISVKLSALHPRFSRAQRERVHAELLPRVAELAKLACHYDIGLNIDAEEADRFDLSLDLVAEVLAESMLKPWQGLGFVVQAYQKRARPAIDWIVALARRHRRRLMIRLVKGAYWDTEIKRAQVDGLAGYPVFTRKVHTDVSYLACAKAMLAAPDAIYPQFASHNAFTIAAIHTLAGAAQYEFQCLHGMGESVYDHVVGPANLDRPCRIYAPVGSHETLLAYLVRRLLENGANSSFVNRIVDPDVSIAALVADPVAVALETGGAPHASIPLPSMLLPGRRNAQGLDLSDDAVLAPLAAALAATPERYAATPLVAFARQSFAAPVEIRNPADRGEVVGTVVEATAEDVTRAVAAAVDVGGAWSATRAAERAGCLERAADLLEAERATFCALAVREAGKTLANAHAEVREAVDFCRYYAAQIRGDPGTPAIAAIGPVAAIAPWNFPLAIFAGQVAAALAAGNPVIAKPAEQTPLIAHEAVRLFHRAGVPTTALQLLPGRGETVGAALVADPRIAGVLFTGSTEVARRIHRVLAARDDDPVLIAETGGQNAMIVDSSALAEQVVADALTSAFDSAGQRCSALRILCLQDDIADPMLTMLEGALRELAIGDPRRLATDVGPVIDEEARAALVAHVAHLSAAGCRVVEVPLTDECARGTFVAPTLIDMGDAGNIARLEREVFGPVLHVVRWRPDELPALVARINALGYGLTHGIHTRIDETADLVLARVRAGNVYVNRNIVGAVVGVQPFGGCGLSGTGPKAGGPLYLRRLVAAVGGDTTPLRREPGWAPGQSPDDLAAGLNAIARVLGAATGLSAMDRRDLDAMLARARLGLGIVPARITLPGPTGESNTLEVTARGSVACIAANARGLLAQAIAAVATGNRLVLPSSALGKALRAAVGESRCVLAEGDGYDAALAVGAPPIDAVLLDMAPAHARAVRTALAAREGPIVPVVTPGVDGGYDWLRLVGERTVTINTAAAGGNAALLSLAEDAPAR